MMTDLSPLPTRASEKTDVAAVVEETADQGNRPRSSLTHHSRKSKRANSNASSSHRQKFRSKLDSLHLYNGEASGFDEKEDAEISTSNYTSSTRHSSSGSVGAPPVRYIPEKHGSPLDYLWSNASLDPLFPIKLITQDQMKSIMHSHYSQPLPDCDHVFPWLHGIHHSNNNQRDFLNSLSSFTSVNRNNFKVFQNQSSKIPSNYRGLITVRSDNINSLETTLASGTLKGSISPVEILEELTTSKLELISFLEGFLTDLNYHTNKGQFEIMVNTLTQDCISLKLIPAFKNLDPEKGISLRNFHIQVSKLAQISDFIVYCFNKDHLFSESHNCQCKSVARLLYFAQLKHAVNNPELVDLLCSTLILEDNDPSFYKLKGNSKLLALDVLSSSDSIITNGNICTSGDLKYFANWESNYLSREKFEISKMSSATETLPNVWVGNTINYETSLKKGFDPSVAKRMRRNSNIPLYIDPENSTMMVSEEELMSQGEDLLINPPAADWKFSVSCSEGFSFPSLNRLRQLLSLKSKAGIHLEFPPSGSVGMGDCTDTDLISIINTCKLVYTGTSELEPSLIYCSDGYTESSLFLALFMIYATAETLTEVIVKLHTKYGRPFFLFPTDVQLISKVEDILIHYSPKRDNITSPFDLEILSDSVIYRHLFSPKEKSWFLGLNGSLPSRILPHLYLGSLSHANELELLKEFNIKRIVSVGENLTWLDSVEHHSSGGLKRKVVNSNITILSNFPKNFPVVKLMAVNNVQDDGIDMLTHNLQDILEYINEGYEHNEPVLVHCRVGVSRSATVCIAEVMKRLHINLIRAYIFVRVRRLNIIIQPNLRFMYELVKWEESQRLKRKSERVRISNEKILEDGKLGSPMKIAFDEEDEEEEDVDDEDRAVHTKNIHKSTLSLSESINSLLSDYSDITEVSMANMVDLVERSDTDSVISRPMRPTYSPVQERSNVSIKVSAEGEDEGTDEDGEEELEDLWLRDVDWHILCREIDALNKVYIRG